MTRSPTAAADFAKSQSHRGVIWRVGVCLKFTRTCFGVSSRYLTASSAYAHAQHRHSTGTPPRGVPVWWTGGSRGFGHVAVSDGGGYCWSTDVLRAGRVDRVKISHITNAWNLPYRGWSEDINGVRVYTPVALPNLHLSYAIEAAHKDAGHPHISTHPVTTKLIAKALYKEGMLGKGYVTGHFSKEKRRAYAKWQRSLGYSGADASGIPGVTSLRKLGSRRGFHVVP
jgi:hypothetical protein